MLSSNLYEDIDLNHFEAFQNWIINSTFLNEIQLLKLCIEHCASDLFGIVNIVRYKTTNSGMLIYNLRLIRNQPLNL